MTWFWRMPLRPFSMGSHADAGAESVRALLLCSPVSA